MADAKVRVVNVNPANIGAAAGGNTDVAIPEVRQGDFVLAVPPVTLEGALAPQGCTVPVDGTVRLRISNPSAAGVDAVAADWTFVIFSEGG
jgi:hypothetical protein